MPIDIGTLSYSLAAILLLLLILTQLKIWKNGQSSFVLLLANVFTLLWCVSLINIQFFTTRSFFLIPAIEIVKYLSWFTFLLSVLGIRQLIVSRNILASENRGLLIIASATLGIPLVVLFSILYLRFFTGNQLLLPNFGSKNVIAGILVSSIAGLALLEQVVRNIRIQHSWHLKYLILGLALLFSYDVYLYSNALLFDRIQGDLWQIRGLVVVISVPLVALGVFRTRQSPIQLNISRRLVFHTSVLVAAGVYFLLMAAAGFYIRNSSGEWGGMLQVAFWIISISLLLILVYSGRLRSLIKVYISRNLFSSKYDYRDEWMRITNTLSQTLSNEPLTNSAIIALADIIDSTGGGLWLTKNSNHFDQVAQVEFGWVENGGLSESEYLLSFLKSTREIIDFSNLPTEFDVTLIPPWLGKNKRIRLVVPLELHGSLIGLIILKQPRVDIELNWEDYDLLNAAGQQTASYLAQMIASDALSEARQFNAFNQGSAFVVHDIKTVNSQLAMLVTNAEKFKDNPSFVADMIKTVSHAVRKMNFLLEHFKNSEREKVQNRDTYNLTHLLSSIIDYQSSRLPVPSLRCSESELYVLGDEAEMQSAIGHIIQNAQEATSDDGRIDVLVKKHLDAVEIIITDSGKGMAQDFIQTRLFKPFETTKGLTGMGIGVYQARESLRKLGGDIRVQSKLDVGSTFVITVPIENHTTSGN